MAQRDGIGVDENFLHQESKDLLALSHIQRISAQAQLSAESGQVRIRNAATSGNPYGRICDSHKCSGGASKLSGSGDKREWTHKCPREEVIAQD